LRFVDPEADFLFVEREDDWASLDAIPFDIRGVELGHHRGRCTFEAVLEKYELRDPTLARMGLAIRAIDIPTEDIDTDPELVRDFDSLRSLDIPDAVRLQRGAMLCDAYYRRCGGRLQ
jgi:hypothetical protein